MKYSRGAIGVLCASLTLTAQDPKGDEGQDDAAIVVTATRTAGNPFDLPYTTSVISSRELRGQLQSRTAPELLKDMPGISVQKTAHGQGSPKFRGQTGFHTLLLVDGIRINDSTWRSGNVEYWNHLDIYSFDRFEVMRGPASVLWGSDAVAGVGQAITRETDFDAEAVRAGSLFRYSSAEDSFVSRVETSGHSGDFGWHVGTTYKDFGDLRAGRDVGLLPQTGYRQADGDAKLAWRLDDRQKISFAAQQNHLKDVPRTHSTIHGVPWRGITAGTDLRREHDHRRQMYWLQYQAEQGGWFDDFTGNLVYKNRYEREDRVRSDSRRQINVLGVETIGLTGQFTSQWGEGRLVYGLDFYHDLIDSSYRDFNADGSPKSTRNRGVVAGDASYDLLGVYAQYDLPVSVNFDLLAGLRWSYAAVDAHDVDVPGDSVVFDDVEDDWSAVTGSLRGVYKPSATWRFFGGLSQGFRAPNLADTTRFDVARSGELEVPAFGLEPEHYSSFELGARYDDGEWAGNLTGWYTLARDQISRFRTGKTVGGLPEVSKSNVGDGWYAGIELAGEVNLSVASDHLADIWLFGWADYVDGRIDQIDSTGKQIEDRPKAMPPASGTLGLRWLHPSGESGVELFTRMAYHIDPSRYTEADRNNTQRVPADGLPGYAVYGLRGWTELREDIVLSLAIENLTDVDFRVMDSGVMEPGMNVILTLQAGF